MTTDDRPNFGWGTVVSSPGLAFLWAYVGGLSLVVLLFFIEVLV